MHARMEVLVPFRTRDSAGVNNATKTTKSTASLQQCPGLTWRWHKANTKRGREPEICFVFFLNGEQFIL